MKAQWHQLLHQWPFKAVLLGAFLQHTAAQPWYYASVASPYPDRGYTFATNATSSFSDGSLVQWQLQVGVQPMPSAPPAAGFADAFGVSLQIGPRWALLNLDNGVIALNAPFVGGLGTPSFVSPATDSIRLLPPRPGSEVVSNDARRYLRTLLTLQYYLIEWAFGFNLDNTGLGSAFGYELYNARAMEQAQVHPLDFVALTGYLGAIAQHLLPGVVFFDDVPVHQLLVANSTNALGVLEPHALYGGKRGQTSSQPSATACAQACFNAGSPFYYCPTEPFDNLAAGGSGENCPPDYCDAWTFCGQSGGCRLYPAYLQPQTALPNEQYTGYVPPSAGTPTYQPPLYILEAEGALSVSEYASSTAARSGGYGGYASGGIGYGSYGGGSYGGGAFPQQGAIVEFPVQPPFEVVPQGTCTFLNVWTDGATFQHYYNVGQFSRLGDDVRGASIPFTSGRILPFPTGAQEF